jgi:membrane protein
MCPNAKSHPTEPDGNPEDQGPPGHDRFRDLAERVVGIAGGIPAVRTLMAVFEVYDRAGGGLVAGGLAYAALIALVPGALLVASAIGFLVDDPALQDAIVEAVANAVPPLEDIARTAIESVAAGAVPTTIIALLGLLWGASRFYASLDYAFSRVFRSARRRNEIERTLRGILVTFLFVGLPIAAVIAVSIASWLLEVAPDQERAEGFASALLQVASPLGSFLLFVGTVSLVYRFVPAERVPVRAFLRPAILVGIVLALFTQLFAFIAPRMFGWMAVYGTFVAVFALLAWLSIGFNLLLLGASWTRVRAVSMDQPEAPAADLDSQAGAGA